MQRYNETNNTICSSCSITTSLTTVLACDKKHFDQILSQEVHDREDRRPHRRLHPPPLLQRQSRLPVRPDPHDQLPPAGGGTVLQYLLLASFVRREPVSELAHHELG